MSLPPPRRRTPPSDRLPVPPAVKTQSCGRQITPVPPSMDLTRRVASSARRSREEEANPSESAHSRGQYLAFLSSPSFRISRWVEALDSRSSRGLPARVMAPVEMQRRFQKRANLIHTRSSASPLDSTGEGTLIAGASLAESRNSRQHAHRLIVGPWEKSCTLRIERTSTGSCCGGKRSAMSFGRSGTRDESGSQTWASGPVSLRSTSLNSSAASKIRPPRCFTRSLTPSKLLSTRLPAAQRPYSTGRSVSDPRSWLWQPDAAHSRFAPHRRVRPTH